MGIFGNVKLKKRQVEVLVGVMESGEEFKITLTAPRLQALTEVEGRIKPPVAPILRQAGQAVVARDPETGKQIKTADGSPIFVRDRKDPEFRDKLATYQQVTAISQFMLMAGDQVRPSKTIEDFKGDWTAYYLAAWEEMEEGGMETGSLIRINKEVSKLLKPMGPEEVEQARRALGTDSESSDAAKERLKGKAPAGKSESASSTGSSKQPSGSTG